MNEHEIPETKNETTPEVETSGIGSFISIGIIALVIILGAVYLAFLK